MTVENRKCEPSIQEKVDLLKGFIEIYKI